MENRTGIGTNRTGLQTAPRHMEKMKEVTELTQPSAGDESAMAALRTAYIAEADPLGSMPPPLTMKGMVKSGMKMMAGQRPQVFLDKLAERLAFERTGTRLYEALITKCQAPFEGPDVVPVAELRHIQAEEAQHFAMLKACIEELGGDPTAQSPCADLVGVESIGLMQVVTDPKTTVNQSLHAILVAELADNAAWEELVVLAREMGHEEMAQRFEAAERNEADHLAKVKAWHQQGTMAEAKMGVKH